MNHSEPGRVQRRVGDPPRWPPLQLFLSTCGYESRDGRQPSCGLGRVPGHSSSPPRPRLPVCEPERLRVMVTSQVWQRPQQASVVTRRPLQPGLWATKENSRTAQPRKPWRVLVRATHTASVPATRSRRRERCILGNKVTLIIQEATTHIEIQSKNA